MNDIKSPPLGEEQLQKYIQQAIEANHIDVPILATRLVGNRLELHLYGGGQVSIAIEGEPPTPTPTQPAKRSILPPKRKKP